MSKPEKKAPLASRRPPKPPSEFLASTPAVSPSQRYNLDGVVTTNRHVSRAGESAVSFTEGRMNPSTPVHGAAGSRAERQGEFHLSPIDRVGEDKLIHTMVHRDGNDTMLPPTTAARTGNQRSVYPFPIPECMQVIPRDKYESVLESLQLLKCMESLEEHDGSADQDSNGTSGRKVASGRPGLLNKDFEFTVDMFKTNNSEAFISVTHFLFDLLDKEESVNRFRNAWPIYEKRQESLYRRAALEWFKEIVTENSVFFPKNFKVEQLQGLVVNSYGDRFIRFINGFVNYVMHEVTSREEDIGDPLLQPPVFTGNPEVTKRQCVVRANRIEQLEHQSVACEVQRLQELIDINHLTTKIQWIEKETTQELQRRKQVVSKLIDTQSDIFPAEAHGLLSEEGNFVRREFKLIPVGDHGKAFHEIRSPLYQHVHAKWIEEVEYLGGKVNGLIEFFQLHSRLYTLLLATAQKRICLDVADLELPRDIKEKEGLRISDILDFFAGTAKMCFNQVNEAEVSPEIISRKKRLGLKLNLLRKKSQDILAMDSVNKAEVNKQLDFEIQKLSIKLENADWSEFSEFHGPPMSTLFNFSPPRLVDTGKKTGLTPAVAGYLSEAAPKYSIVDGLNQSKQVELLARSRNDSLSVRTFDKIRNVITCGGVTSSASFKPDMCDSPISHRPANQIEPMVLLQPRNSRRSSLSKFRLSLPPSIEGDELPGNGGSSALVEDATAEDSETTEVIGTNEGLPVDSQDRMNELRKCFASATLETPLEQSVLKSKARRRSSLSLKGKKLQDSNESLIDDLEGILGIMDVTLSYGDFLDVSMDCDEDQES